MGSEDFMTFKNRTSVMLELGLEEALLSRVEAYINLLWRANEELNLFSRQMTFEELIDNHLIDCLLPLVQFPKTVQAVADFGSGGGLPGVLYAIAFPSIKFHLYEKSPKKQEFLQRCQKIAKNIEIHGELPLKLEGIDVVIARAFKPLDVLLEMSRDYFLNGGHYFLLKGRKDKIDEEIVLASKKFKELKVEVVPLVSPVLQVERHLVVI
jgi:16S rRNA (guanine527-N7)-methyltransferase